MRIVYHLIFLFLFIVPGYAQLTSYTAFTVNDGLPSNNIYGTLEDDKGFLWIATDAGVARFDGKHFQVFTTDQGLPDNDVLSVVKEKTGRIWVNCFKQSPAYFDEVKNRFINSVKDSMVAKLAGTALMWLYALPDGGVMFTNEKGCYIFKNKRLIESPGKPNDIKFLIKKNNDGSELRFGDDFLITQKNNQSKIYHTQNSIKIDSAATSIMAADYYVQGLDNGNFYLFNHSKHKCFIYSNFNISPLSFILDSINLPESFFHFSFTSTYLNLYCTSGVTSVLDKKTLKKLFVISGNYVANTLNNDNKGNLWISTVDKGLVLYKKKKIGNLPMPASFTHTNFLSIARKTDGSILAGNFYGEVLEINGSKFYIHATKIKTKSLNKERKILQSQNKIFTFSESNIYVNYNHRLSSSGSAAFPAKTGIIYNDSIVLVGGIRTIYKINSRTEEVVTSRTGKRVTALAKLNDSVIYFGSTDGLYKYDFIRSTYKALNLTNSKLSDRVVALCVTSDNLLWMVTPGNGVVVIKDDKVIGNIKENEETNYTSRCITATKPGHIWLGSSAGISMISYKLNNNKITYSTQHFSVIDGLASNVVNEMLYDNDTVYAATADGISVIPVNFSIPVFSIPVQLINVSINQRDTIIASDYNLGFDQQNIVFRFAAIELTGHFKNLQYTLDNNKNWVNLSTNILSLQLNDGNHNLEVRAIDVNGNISDQILTIHINIATPFWKAIWFWLMIVIVMQLLTVYFAKRWYKKRKQTKLAKEIASVQTASLEQQAFTSLMNPHFMFNALNSIQHYINVQDRKNANRYLTDFASLIRKNFEAAQQSFVSLEQELENIKIYLRLEQMRFTNRFAYTITIDEGMDADNWMIPTMMLQPLLENALLHGIMPSTIAGELLIDLKEMNKDLLITITDNGIGIENSRASKMNDLHKSRGMELIQKRIAALSHFVKQPVTINMIPAFDSDKNPGNKVKIFIPADLYEAWLLAQKR